MVVVLFVGLILVAILATFLHRRHRRRVEATENPGPRPDIGDWAPNPHSVHDLRGFGNPKASAADTEKGKGKVADNAQLGSRTESKRLKKHVFARVRKI